MSTHPPSSQSVLRAAEAVNDSPLSPSHTSGSQEMDIHHNPRSEIYLYTRDVQSRPGVETSRRIQHKLLAANYFLGYSLLQFGGPEPVRALIDPQVRANPRLRQTSHCRRLLASFKTEKMDRHNPIVIFAPKHIISDDDRVHMSKVDPFKPSPAPRPFKLANKSAEEYELDEIIWTGLEKSGRALEDSYILRCSERRDLLISERVRATLANGSHRWGAMEELSQEIHEQHSRYRREFVESSDIGAFVESMKRLAEDLPHYTFWVEVYDDTMPQELRASVAENPELLQLPEGVGESVFIRSEKWTGVFQQMTAEQPQQSYEDRMNLTHQALMPVPPIRKTDGSSPTAITELLFSNSALVEMMLHSRHALWVFDEVAKSQHAKALLSISGGLLAAYYWLSMNVLIKVCDVDPDAAALNEGRQYVGKFSYESIPASGDKASVPLWQLLHPAARHPRNPPLISLYDDLAAEDLGHSYASFVKERLNAHARNTGSSSLFDWTNPGSDVIRDVRAMHFRLADRILARHGPQAGRDVQALSVSLKLYSLLPAGSEFQPRAPLPCKEFFDQCRISSKWFDGPGCLLVEIDMAFDRHSVIWAHSHSSGNWYSSIPASHKVLQACINNPGLGNMDERLLSALGILENADVQACLALAKSKYSDWSINTPENSFHRLRVACGTFHSPADYSILAEEGRVVDKGLLQQARRSLLEYACSKDGVIGAVVGSHPCLEMVSPDFWRLFQFRRWLTGHSAALPAAMMRNVRVAIGWGLFVDRLLDRFVKPALSAHPVLRTLLEISVANNSAPAWWTDVLPAKGTLARGIDSQIIRTEAGPSRASAARRGPSPAEWRIVKKKGRNKKKSGPKPNIIPRPVSRPNIPSPSLPASTPSFTPAPEISRTLVNVSYSHEGVPHASFAAQLPDSPLPPGSTPAPHEGGSSPWNISGLLQGPNMPFTLTGRIAADVDFNTPLVNSRHTAFTLQNFVALDILGAHFEGTLKDEKAIVNALSEFQTTTPELIDAIFQVRKGFRHTVVSLASAIIDSPMGPAFAATGLGTLAILLKESYVVALAHAISVKTGCEEHCVMNEALRIARADQLWMRQLLPLHRVESGQIHIGVDLQSSRPSVNQNTDEEPFSVGIISTSPQEFSSMQRFSKIFSTLLGVGVTEQQSYHGASSSCDLLHQQLEPPLPDHRYTTERPSVAVIQEGNGSIPSAPEAVAPIFPPGSIPNTPASLSESHLTMTKDQSRALSVSSSQPNFTVAEWPNSSRAASQVDLLREVVEKDPSQRFPCNMSLINDGDMYFGDSPSCFSTSSFASTQEVPSFFPGGPVSTFLNRSLRETLRRVGVAWGASLADDDRSFNDLMDLISPRSSPEHPQPRILVPDSDAMEEMDEDGY